ncbi:MAG: sigma-70 family RNA polymerase sigma factor [Planctomycetota bacterium]
MTDQDLLRAYVDSEDVDSLGTFLSRYQSPLLRFVSRFLKDDAAAQDIVQETFLRVVRQPNRLLDVASCHNWLLRVARNLSVDYLRGAIRLRKQASELAEESAATASTTADLSADRSLEKEEARERVRQEIAGLQPRHRELMLLRVQEGKTYREIAEITGLTVTNVGYLIHQAMKTLAVRLQDLNEDRS